MQMLVGALTIKALRKCFGSLICREVSRQDDLPSILIAVKTAWAHTDCDRAIAASRPSHEQDPELVLERSRFSCVSPKMLALNRGVPVLIGCQMKEL